MRRFTSLTAAAAVVLTSVGLSATPADARSRHGGWGRHHDNGISAGEVIGGLFVIGAIAAIASSASKDKYDRDDRYEPPYRGDDYREVPRYVPNDGGTYDDGAYEEGTYGNDGYGSDAYGSSDAERRAADACSWAVEGEMGDDARVDRVDAGQPSNGGWYITGIASRPGDDARSFGCSYRAGRVVDVNFGG